MSKCEHCGAHDHEEKEEKQSLLDDVSGEVYELK